MDEHLLKSVRKHARMHTAHMHTARNYDYMYQRQINYLHHKDRIGLVMLRCDVFESDKWNCVVNMDAHASSHPTVLPAGKHARAPGNWFDSK